MIDDVRCTATESRLIADCPFTFNRNCVHSEDAGVRCTLSSIDMLHYIHYDHACIHVCHVHVHVHVYQVYAHPFGAWPACLPFQ